MKKIIALLFVLVFLVSCATQEAVKPVLQQSAPQTLNPKLQTGTEIGSALVEIKDFTFSPADLHVKAGTVVEWINLDSAQHTVTSTSGPESFDSKALKKDQKYAFTFSKPGTYEYYCSLHPGMSAKVVVE